MKTKDLILTAIFTAFTAVGAFISIPLGPIPITLQSFFVLLAGLILEPKLAFLSQVTYVILGLIGIPIFANFTGGPQQIFSPSFGFLLGFILSAFFISVFINFNKFSKKNIFLALSLGTIIIYALGLSYMYFIFNFVMKTPLTFKEVFKLGCLAFLPGDGLKLILSAIIGHKIIPIINKRKDMSI